MRVAAVRGRPIAAIQIGALEHYGENTSRGPQPQLQATTAVTGHRQCNRARVIISHMAALFSMSIGSFLRVFLQNNTTKSETYFQYLRTCQERASVWTERCAEAIAPEAHIGAIGPEERSLWSALLWSAQPQKRSHNVQRARMGVWLADEVAGVEQPGDQRLVQPRRRPRGTSA